MNLSPELEVKLAALTETEALELLAQVNLALRYLHHAWRRAPRVPRPRSNHRQVARPPAPGLGRPETKRGRVRANPVKPTSRSRKRPT